MRKKVSTSIKLNTGWLKKTLKLSHTVEYIYNLITIRIIKLEEKKKNYKSNIYQ